MGRPLKNKGFSLIEVIAIIGVSSVVILGSSQVVLNTVNIEKDSNKQFWLSARRAEIQSVVKSDVGWNQILAANPNMDCFAAGDCSTFNSEQPLQLPINDVVLDGASTQTGMNYKGDFCNNFNAAAPVEPCSIGISLKWQAVCESAACRNPQPQVKISFTDKTAPLKNLDILVFKDPKMDTLSEVCASMGGVFTAPNCVLPQMTSYCDPSIGQFVLGFDSNGNAICGQPTPGNCSSTDVARGFNASGGVSCTPACP